MDNRANLRKSHFSVKAHKVADLAKANTVKAFEAVSNTIGACTTSDQLQKQLLETD